MAADDQPVPGAAEEQRRGSRRPRRTRLRRAVPGPRLGNAARKGPQVPAPRLASPSPGPGPCLSSPASTCPSNAGPAPPRRSWGRRSGPVHSQGNPIPMRLRPLRCLSRRESHPPRGGLGCPPPGRPARLRAPSPLPPRKAGPGCVIGKTRDPEAGRAGAPGMRYHSAHAAALGMHGTRKGPLPGPGLARGPQVASPRAMGRWPDSSHVQPRGLAEASPADPSCTSGQVTPAALLPGRGHRVGHRVAPVGYLT